APLSRARTHARRARRALGGGAMNGWEPQEPPRDFAEKVLARARAEDAQGSGPSDEDSEGASASRLSHTKWRRAGFVAAASLAAAAAFALVWSTRSASYGEAIARDRVQIAIGDRAAAVLEAGAHVAWKGDDVTQSAGDVFYRVE